MKRTERHMEYILQDILRIWKKYPEYRLCQLIVNATQRQDPYYVEDVALVQHLEDFPPSQEEDLPYGGGIWKDD